MNGSRMQEPPQAGAGEAEAPPDLRAIARLAAAMQAAESSAVAGQQEAAAGSAAPSAERQSAAAGDGSPGRSALAVKQPSTRVDSLTPPETPVVASAKLQVRRCLLL
jgi:hypothetical protein